MFRFKPLGFSKEASVKSSCLSRQGGLQQGGHSIKLPDPQVHGGEASIDEFLEYYLTLMCLSRPLVECLLAPSHSQQPYPISNRFIRAPDRPGWNHLKHRMNLGVRLSLLSLANEPVPDLLSCPKGKHCHKVFVLGPLTLSVYIRGRAQVRISVPIVAVHHITFRPRTYRKSQFISI